MCSAGGAHAPALARVARDALPSRAWTRCTHSHAARGYATTVSWARRSTTVHRHACRDLPRRGLFDSERRGLRCLCTSSLSEHPGEPSGDGAIFSANAAGETSTQSTPQEQASSEKRTSRQSVSDDGLSPCLRTRRHRRGRHAGRRLCQVGEPTRLSPGPLRPWRHRRL